MNFGGNHIKKNKFPKNKKQNQELIWTTPYLHYDDQHIKFKRKSGNQKKSESLSKNKIYESEQSIPEARGLVGRNKRYA